VHVATGITLDTANLVFVLRNDDVRGIALALGAICLDVRPDFVDLVFAIEKRFGVKLRDDELDALSHLDFSSPDVMRNGFLTREVIERLTPALPALRDLPDPERVTPAAVFGLVTVAVLTAMVERKATSPDR